MYKLFLTLRYLTRKKIVIFPILVVWLCLMMMIIVTSIMGGFVDHVRQANRDLLGDIVISVKDPAGWAGYGKLQEEIKAKVPELEVSTPVIHSFGLIGGTGAAYGVDIVGIDPVARSKVSRFWETLYHQYKAPMAAVEDLGKYLPATGAELQKDSENASGDATKQYHAARDIAEHVDPNAPTYPNLFWLWGLVPLGGLEFLLLARRRRTLGSWVTAIAVLVIGGGVVAMGTMWPVKFPTTYELAGDAFERARLDVDRANSDADYAAILPAAQKVTSKAELEKLFVPAEPSFAVPANMRNSPTDEGCIIGSQIILHRDIRGNFMRDPGGDYASVKLTVVPVSTNGVVHTVSADQRPFTIIDDSYTGVADVDSTYVYAPFATIQAMAGMRVDDSDVKPGSPGWFEPRCSEVLIKLREGIDQPEMYVIRNRIEKIVRDFQAANPEVYSYPLRVQTWDQRQQTYLNAVENEKGMQQFILGLMSCVVLVVVFLIFYMIVRDKTRDIGIIKAVGGSEEGVAGIFLFYGLFIGVVGGILGVISGVEFVLHTNEIHEFIYHMTGRVIWDRSVYMFDEIPHTVHPTEVAIYFGAALIAGVVGALIPAIVAGSQDPVKAVRYE